MSNVIGIGIVNSPIGINNNITLHQVISADPSSRTLRDLTFLMNFDSLKWSYFVFQAFILYSHQVLPGNYCKVINDFSLEWYKLTNQFDIVRL